MKQKTILFITREIVPFYYGGIGTLFLSMSILLKNNGHKVSFLTQKTDDFDVDIYKRYYGDTSVFFVDSPGEDAFVNYSPSGGIVSSFNLAYAFSVEEAFNQSITTNKPDIVITADFGAEAFILLLRKSLGSYADIHFICHLSGALKEVLETYQSGVDKSVFDELDEPRNKLVCAMEDSCMLLANDIVAPSYHAWHDLSSRLELQNAHVKIIPNLLSQKFRERLENKQLVMNKKDENIVLFIGRLDRHKGADILIKLYLEYLHKYASGSKLIFIGRDCYCKEYNRTFIEEWQEKVPQEYRDQILFTGQLAHEEIRAYLKKADLCVFPSRWEVFGIVCLESMAYGVPVLVSKGTGLVELLGDNLQANSLDFEEEKDHFIERLHELLTTQDQNLKLREEIRNRAIDIVKQGEQGYLLLIEEAEKQVRREGISDSIVDRLLLSLKAISDISGFLNRDFLKLKFFHGSSDEDIKSIIQQGSVPP